MCKHCGEPIVGKRKHAVYCSTNCKNKAEYHRSGRKSKYSAEKHREKARVNWIFKTYGLTPEQWQSLFERQGSRCAICKVTEAQWHTDHDHATGKVRGILCRNCNLMIGHAKDSRESLLAAILYLSH